MWLVPANYNIRKVKDIVQPKKRGVNGVPIDSPRLLTQSLMFFQVHLKGYSRALNYIKNRLQCYGKGLKKVESFYVEFATEARYDIALQLI